jgi:ribosomal protein S16
MKLDEYLIESQDIVCTGGFRFSQSLAAQTDNSFIELLERYRPIATQAKVILEMNGDWILKRTSNNRKPTAKLVDLVIP